MSKRAEGALPGDLERALLLAIRPEPVEPERAASLKTKILDRVRQESGPGTITLRAHEGEWIALGPKVEMKLLREDETSRTFLLRMHPGAVLPAHGHPMEEECLVLEGEVQLGEVIARAGDFHLAPKGVPHGVVRSEKGALLFLRGANPAHYAPGA